MRIRLRLALVAIAAITLTLGIAGAGQSAKRDLISLKYSTSFGTFGREAYVYVALEKGYFRDAGFDVSVVPGSGTVGVVRLLAAGQIDYGPGDVTSMMVAKGNEDLAVKFVGLIHQNTLSGFLALKESGISKPKDLEGKKVADTAGSTATVLFPYFAKKAGIDASKVTFVPATTSALPTLLAAKQVDAVGQFMVGIPLFRAAAGGKEINSLPYSKTVPGLMGNGILVSEKRLREDPAQVRKFVAALLKGLRYSLDNPGQAGAILQKYVPLANYEIAAKELRIMKRYSESADTKKYGLGYTDPKRVASAVSIVNNFFKPKTRLSMNDVYAPGFLPTKPIK